MRRLSQTGLLLLVACVLAPLAGAAEPGESSASLSSKKEKGVVSLAPDAALVDGRLALKVVAFNPTGAPASFGPEQIKVFTASGKPVKLMTVDALVAEARGTARRGGASRAHQPANYSGPSISHDSAGRPDVSGYTGGGVPMGGGLSPHTSATASAGSSVQDQQVEAQVASIKAALLQQMTVAPSSAAGGQVVTDKLKFSRKEERALRVVVDFNGELHEIRFAAPPPG